MPAYRDQAVYTAAYFLHEACAARSAPDEICCHGLVPVNSDQMAPPQR